MHWKNREGFSLVELAVVLVVAGIILAMGVPNILKHMHSQSVRDSARMLSDEMRLARQKAVSNGTRNYVYTQWGPGADQYWTGIQTQNPNTGAWSSILWRGPIELPGRTRQISASFGSYVYFYYDPSGRPKTPLDTPSSGSIKVVSTIPSVNDTAAVNVDLSGSVW